MERAQSKPANKILSALYGLLFTTLFAGYFVWLLQAPAQIYTKNSATPLTGSGLLIGLCFLVSLLLLIFLCCARIGGSFVLPSWAILLCLFAQGAITGALSLWSFVWLSYSSSLWIFVSASAPLIPFLVVALALLFAALTRTKDLARRQLYIKLVWIVPPAFLLFWTGVVVLIRLTL
ncbi:hypothetical protein FHU41_001863 [Psychromicrobium silvestre]|uniref:Uncharacterized protein n=1 Tax=Psychromicrobium silvestre TaxID=1645614 RepID=A0A7Y9S6T3_9MICC|nr:hypothetical protein [Psychromicrobium silvestre]NYE95613.1 hypothetical protein [Psychromicrobium silvestre]